jgi:hypothetical protein
MRDAPNELKPFDNGCGGRDRLDFQTVRPRVQIPGPRPVFDFRLSGAKVIMMLHHYSSSTAWWLRCP